MVSLREWINNNSNLCPACSSAKIVVVHEIAVFQCNYCGIKVSDEVMCADRDSDEIAALLYTIKVKWSRQLKLLHSTSTEALYDILVARGVLQPKPETTNLHNQAISNLIKDVYAPMIEDQLKVDLIFLHHPSHSDEPKPWSYEEAAASEFNLKDEGTGLQ